MADLQTNRPRLTRLERAAQLRARAERLECVERQQARKRDARRKIVIGGAAIAEARGNPEFRAMLAEVLKSRVTRELDAEAVTSWLSIT